MSDMTLIQRSIDGDEDASRELVRKYQKRVYALSYRMTQNVEDAQDIAQMTFIRALSKLKDFRGESSLYTWLYRVCVNLCLRHFEKNRPAGDAVPAGAEPENILSAVERRERVDHLKECLRHVPLRQRTAVVLRTFEALSVRDAAAVMQCSEGAVKANYHLGVQRLRELMKERGHEVEA
jgi:RNA polymerase sigma-70 factor (ECF subfamily)